MPDLGKLSLYLDLKLRMNTHCCEWLRCVEEVGDAMWNIVYYNTILGRIDLQTGRITGTNHV
jgi:hypothetical protein